MKFTKTNRTKTKSKTKKLTKNNYLKFKMNKKIVDYFLLLEQYYRKIRDNIRANSYNRTIFQIKRFPTKIHSSSQLKHLEGIGKKTLIKIDEIIKTGKLRLITDLNITEFLKKYYFEDSIVQILGFGPAMINKIKSKGINSIEDLEIAHQHNIIKLNTQQQIGLKYRKELEKLIPRKETEKIVAKIEKALSQEVNNKSNLIKQYQLNISIAGSYPSGKLKSKDIDILISTPLLKSQSSFKNSTYLQNIINRLTDQHIVTHIISLGPSKFLGLARLNSKKLHRHLDIRLVPESSFIFSYLYYTSGRNFNLIMRKKAKKNGYLLNEWGLYDSNKKKIKVKNEKDIFNKIGMSYIPEQDRR